MNTSASTVPDLAPDPVEEAVEVGRDEPTYSATGLPPGVRLGRDGMMSGRVTTLGTHTVTITTTAPQEVPRQVTFDWIVL